MRLWAAKTAGPTPPLSTGSTGGPPSRCWSTSRCGGGAVGRGGVELWWGTWQRHLLAQGDQQRQRPVLPHIAPAWYPACLPLAPGRGHRRMVPPGPQAARPGNPTSICTCLRCCRRPRPSRRARSTFSPSSWMASSCMTLWWSAAAPARTAGPSEGLLLRAAHCGMAGTLTPPLFCLPLLASSQR